MFHDIDVGQPVNVAYLFSETHEFGIESLELPGHFMGCSLVEAVKASHLVDSGVPEIGRACSGGSRWCLEVLL